jgi:hypothetical protein
MGKLGHWGGRLLWQVEGSKDFVILFIKTDESQARALEKELLGEFKGTFFRLPFANLSQ